MKNFYLLFLFSFALSLAYAQEEELIPGALIGSCLEADSNLVNIYFDYSKNCTQADPQGLLADKEELGFHSGINNWAKIVEFSAEGAARLKHLGNGIYSLSINTLDYYGTPLADIENIKFVIRSANPNDSWDASARDDKGGGGFGGDEPCNDFELTIAKMLSCAALAQESSASLLGATTIANSCVNAEKGTVTIEFDQSLNCKEADPSGVLAGATALGFHSGANDWASAIAWDSEKAVTATNNGKNIFTLTINVEDYYGIPFDSLRNIKMVLNNGVANPAEPWSTTGRDDRDGGFGGTEPCSDLILLIAEAPACPVEPETVTSKALFSATENQKTCVDPSTGRARIAFDNSLNCPEADSGNVLASATALGFHSGANDWASVISWDDAKGVQAVNDGAGIFSVTVDIQEYYGIPFDSMRNIKMVFNNGPANPSAAWDATGRDDRDAESFGEINPCSDLILDFSEAPICDLSDPVEFNTSKALFSEAAGSCVDRNFGLVKIAFDNTLNCPEADTEKVLAEATALGFHSGANSWSSVVAWDDAGAKTAVNNGNGVFSVVINPLKYYGISLDSLSTISMVMNNGVMNPDAAWSATGRDERNGGFGGDEPCSDLIFDISEAPSCDLSETTSSHALLNGLANSCIDTTKGLVKIDFDYNFNCPEADATNLLQGAEAIAFHSGVNNWTTQVAWDDAKAQNAVNKGGNLFSLTLDVKAYYGMDLQDIESINFLFNNGLSNPAAAWDNKGEDSRNGSGFGESPCSNLILTIAEAPVCDLLSTQTIDLQLENSLRVYPNPFSDQVVIEFDNPNYERFDLTIHDISGKTVRQLTNITDNQVIIKKQELQQGIYFAVLRGMDGRIATAKLIVQ